MEIESMINFLTMMYDILYYGRKNLFVELLNPFYANVNAVHPKFWYLSQLAGRGCGKRKTITIGYHGYYSHIIIWVQKWFSAMPPWKFLNAFVSCKMPL